MSSISESELLEGYRDGRDLNSPEPSDNRSELYRVGFRNGRDDLNRSPRAFAQTIREEVAAAERKERDR